MLEKPGMFLFGAYDKAVYTILLYNSYNLPDEVRGIQFNDLSPIK